MRLEFKFARDGIPLATGGAGVVHFAPREALHGDAALGRTQIRRAAVQTQRSLGGMRMLNSRPVAQDRRRVGR